MNQTVETEVATAAAPKKRGLILAVVNEKGGVGKTNTAVGLGVAAAMTGADVLMVDTDPQGSMTAWASTRSALGHIPNITTIVKQGEFQNDILKMASKFDVVVIDSGGRDSLEMRHALAVADFTLIPVEPSQYDIWSLGRVAKMIQEVNRQLSIGSEPRQVNAYSFINNAPTNNTHEVEDCREVLKDLQNDFPDIGLVLYNRIAHRKSARVGMGVMELPKGDFDPKAAYEVAMLYQIAFGKAWQPLPVLTASHHEAVIQEIHAKFVEAQASAEGELNGTSAEEVASEGGKQNVKTKG